MYRRGYRDERRASRFATLAASGEKFLHFGNDSPLSVIRRDHTESRMQHRKRARPDTPERYLWRKPGARHLWFRMAVPVRFRLVEARKIVQQSLGTADRKIASLRAAELRLGLMRQWDARALPSAQSSQEPAEVDLQRAATDLGYTRTDAMLNEWWSAAKDAGADGFGHYLNHLGQRRRRYLEQRETSEASLWRYVAEQLATENGWTLTDETRERLGQMVAEALIDRLRVEMEWKNGNFAVEPSSKVVRAGLKARSTGRADGEPIVLLFERYAQQRLAEGRKRADTVAQDRVIVRQFASFVGDHRSARSIVPADIRDWRDTVAALPPAFNSAAAYRDLSLREAAAKARESGARKLSPTTVNKYLSTVSPFFGWCVRNDYADRNPCDGLFYDLVKGRNPRPPFSSVQLTELLQSPLFTGFECDGREHRPGAKQARDWRFWIPLVCLFTGARISEIAQLRCDDVQADGDTPYLCIRHDAARGQQTKSGKNRIAPLHHKLIELGFLHFVKQRRDEAGCEDEFLFPNLERNSRDCIGAIPSRFWRDYLRRIGIKANADGLGSHSFRHTVADLLRQAGYLDDEIEVALGHNQKTVTAGYGMLKQGTVQRLTSMIESINFDEFWTVETNSKISRR
ncbi:integrase [Sphingomonas sp. F9_3S_D5_B_2]